MISSSMIAGKIHPESGKAIINSGYLKNRATFWPVSCPYRVLTEGTNWRNFLERDVWRANRKGELIYIDNTKMVDQQSIFKYLLRNIQDRRLSLVLPVSALSSM